MTVNSLTPKDYRPRLIEARLDELMSAFGCVEIHGPKWCGKTWTAMTRSASMTKLDSVSERRAAEIDPALALVGEAPHLVDEWQEVPEVWDAARRFVDESGNKRGLLLLTGSTALKESERNRVHHTGAGRIGRLKMRPMALCELGESSAVISLRSLLEGKTLQPMRAETEVADVVRWCIRGGWPANLGLSDAAAAETATQYIQAVLDVNVVEENRSPETAFSLLKALAMNSSQAVTLKTLAADMSYGEKAPSAGTINAYLDLFDRLGLTEPLYGWEPPLRAKTRVRIKPKRYFCDPSLAAALLNATEKGLLHDTQTLGLLFENLITRDLQVFLSTYGGLGNKLCYYRDDKGLEVDAIIEYQGSWAGIEVKLSDTKADDGAENLIRLRNKVLANPATQNAEPAFLAVIVGRGRMAYTRDDGVIVIPAALLGA